jgi:uncharacterized membrane protein
MAVLLTCYVSVGLIIAILSLPLVFRMIPPNRWYGFRTRRTRANADVWYAANEYLGGWLFSLGILVAVASVALYCVPGLTDDLYAMTMTAILLAGTAIALVQSYRFLWRLGKQADAADRPATSEEADGGRRF